MTKRPLKTRRSLFKALGAASAAAGGAVLGFPAAAEAGSGAPKGQRPGGELDRFIGRLAAEDAFSGTVLIAHKGRTVLARSHGMANRAEGIANGPGTVFQLASITKCFTGLAVAQLAAEGSIAFHDVLGTRLDGFPAEIADAATVHQLLTHTSGVGRPPVGTQLPPGWDTWASMEEVVEGTMAFIRTLPPRFTPGSRYAYSNDAYWVLGAIVAEVSGMPFVEYVRERILRPAGMTRTDFHTRPQVLADPGIAHPYWTGPDGERTDFTTSRYFQFAGGPDGGLYSTAPDLLRFARALRDGTLLAPAFTALITGGKTPVPPGDGPAREGVRFAGYGFSDTVRGGRHLVGHSGHAAGTATNLDITEDRDLVMIVLGNYDTGTDAIVESARDLAAAG